MRTALLGRPFPEVSVGDVEKEFGRNAFDVVVTNLPWGVRTAKAEDFAKLYRRFCWYVGLVVTPGGRAVCLTVQWRLLLELARSSGLWEVAGVHAVRTGEQTPVVLVLKRVVDAPLAAAWAALAALGDASARNPEPLSFYDDRDAVHKFHRLFEWVVRGNSIYNFYYERALELNQY